MIGQRFIGLAAVVALVVGGCGAAQDGKVAELEKRVAQVEQELAKLKGPAAEAAKAVPVKATGAALHPTWADVAMDPATQKGLSWLISVQGSDGGWGQDGGHGADIRKSDNQESSGNDVANTSLVCMALLRAGHTPKAGKYAAALKKAVEFILGQVEESPQDGLAVTKRQGTQIQRKLGPHIDTFLSSLVLAEVDGMMADERSNKRVRAALDKVVAKIQKNQQSDGSWNVGGGWAPVIGTSMASRGLFRAQQKGAAVDESALKKVDEYTAGNFDKEKKTFAATPSAAGVPLYQVAQALEQGNRTDESRKESVDMLGAAKSALASESFVAGFGSMGGEEFVSYMNISDALLKSGGTDWAAWNGKIKAHLVKLQNQDGTWAGHHCITGRVACTSAAIMTLLSERTAPRI